MLYEWNPSILKDYGPGAIVIYASSEEEAREKGIKKAVSLIQDPDGDFSNYLEVVRAPIDKEDYDELVQETTKEFQKEPTEHEDDTFWFYGSD